MGESRKWPGNDLSRLTEADRILHDHLCELLSDGMSEGDVCTASVGVWGALSVMRDSLNLTILESEARQTRINDLNQNVDRLQTLVTDFNSQVKMIASLREEIAALREAIKYSNIGRPGEASLQNANAIRDAREGSGNE